MVRASPTTKAPESPEDRTTPVSCTSSVTGAPGPTATVTTDTEPPQGVTFLSLVSPPVQIQVTGGVTRLTLHTPTLSLRPSYDTLGTPGGLFSVAYTVRGREHPEETSPLPPSLRGRSEHRSSSRPQSPGTLCTSTICPLDGLVQVIQKQQRQKQNNQKTKKQKMSTSE